MAQIKIDAEELDKLRSDRASLLEFVRYMRDWGRVNEPYIKSRAIKALNSAGEEQ